jgi:hypothetical protein
MHEVEMTAIATMYLETARCFHARLKARIFTRKGQ